MADVDSDALDALTRRLGLLRRLCEGPVHKRDLVEDLDQSRSTIDRGVSELEAMDLVERRDGGYAATVAGRLAVEHLESFQAGYEDVADAEAVLSPLPVDAPITPAAVTGGEAILGSGPTPYRPIERLNDAIEGARAARVLLPALADPRQVRLLYEHVVTDDRPAELVVTPALFETLRSEFPRRTAAMAEREQFRVLVTDAVPEFALGLTEDESGALSVTVGVCSDAGGLHGLLTNDTASALRWAEGLYDEVRADAENRTDALLADTDGGVRAVGTAGRPPIGQSLPVSLERAGFLRLDADYFRDEPTADPTTAWRAGLSLPEVHTGYAVERAPPAALTRGDGKGSEESGDRGDFSPAPADDPDAGSEASMTAALLEAAAAGVDSVVVGPPGAGKSTVCKRVACRWYDEGRGPVLYREGGRGRPFDAVDDLVAAVERAEGHTLVVVEDAVRPETAAVFEAARRLGDRSDVSFLFDARESEWRDPPAEVADADLRVVPMPTLDEAAIERLVAQFERTLGEPVDVPVERLHAEVRRETDDLAPSGVVLLLHRLANYADPLADGRTTLEESVAGVYDDLDDLGRSVCVLANALTAAGVAVTRPALYAVAAPGEFAAVDDALERLEGRLLFPRPDGDYRTVHESWAVALLAHALDTEGERAADRFGAAVTDLLALADDPERRERIAAHLDGAGGATLAAAGADPETWVAETVESVDALARERPKLAPLYGDGSADGDTVVLPAAAPAWLRAERPVRLGRGFLAGGYYDRAERAFRRLPAEGDLGVERLVGLSRIATERGEYDDAVEFAEAAIALTEDDDDRPAEDGKRDGDGPTGDQRDDEPSFDRDRAALAAGRALAERGDYWDAVEHLRTALGGFTTRSDRRRAATTLSLLGSIAQQQGEYGAAAERHRRSLSLSRDLGDRAGEADSLTQLGSVAFSEGDYDRAREQYEQGLDIRRELGDRGGEVESLRRVGGVAHYTGDHDRARQYYEEALSLARDLGMESRAAAVLGNLGLLDERQGRYDRAVERIQRAIETAEDGGSTLHLATRLNNLGLVRVRRAEHDRSREAFDRARRLAAEHDLRRQEANGYSGLGHVARLQGRYERARDCHEQALSIVREMGHARREADQHNKLGLVALRRAAPDRSGGTLDRAREHLERGLSLTREIDHPHEEAVSLLGLGGVDRLTGDHERAADRLATALETSVSIGDRLVTAQVRLARARLALDRDDPETARERGEAALSEFEAMGATQWAARARRLLGRVAAAAGERESARERLLSALETFEAVEAPQDALATLSALVDLESGAEWDERVREVAAEAPEPALEGYDDLVGDPLDDGE